MERDLYLHEVVDITGLGSWPYMRHTLAASGEEKVNFVLQGTFSVMGVTGRWPQVVNIWDVPGGWDGWLESVERLNLARRTNTELEGWWTEAYRYRSGGFDRLLAGAAGSPTTDQLVSAGVRGTLFVHEVAEVRAGSAPEYLAAVLDERVDLMARFDHTLTGAYEVVYSDTEVITVWATTPESHVSLMRSDDPRIGRWRRRAGEWVVHRRAELMTPCPGIVIGPPAED